MKPSVFVLAAAFASLVNACNSTPAASTSGASSTVLVASPTEPSAEPEPEDSTPTSAPTQAPMPNASIDPAAPPLDFRLDGGFGCSTFDPVKSQDACTSAIDCAPSALCHAPSCIAASKAPPKPPGLQSTMNLVCKSLDVGRCDCVDGVCALVPR